MDPTPQKNAGGEAAQNFPATRWSVVRRLSADETRVAAEALEILCGAYRYPIYAFLRRSGHSPEDAEDWTQGFFAYVLETGLVSQASPEKGRFRSFLLGCLKNFISTERRKQSAEKRGGGRALLSLDDETAEERYRREPVERHTPETLFELSWARTVLAQALSSLEKEYASGGKRVVFKRLEPYLHGGDRGPSYAESAAALGKSEDAVKSAVQRLRQRYHFWLRAAIARTVPDASEVEDELRHLRQVLVG